MRIYLIRHGETDWNLQGRLQGREDIPLNETGRMQARQSGRVLQKTGVKTIITSPLIRAVETARIISKSLDKARLIIDDDLIERDFASLSGMTYDRSKYFDTFGVAGNSLEPLDKLSKRLIDCITSYAKKYPKQDIIMVSHGAAINAVISVLTQGKNGTGVTGLKNACICILTYENKQLQLEAFNLSAKEFEDRP